MKKVVSLFLAVLMLVSAVPIVVFAAEASHGHYGLGDGTIYWEVSGDTLYVRRAKLDLGDHCIAIFRAPFSVWDPYLSQIKCINLTHISEIYNITFKDFYNVEKINLVNCKITAYQEECFSGCRSLESIPLPDTLTTIGSVAFDDCDSIEEMILPKSVTYLGNAVFNSCASLKTVSIPDSVTSFGTEMFQYCTKLENVRLPSHLTIIPKRTFYGCTSLKNFWIGKNIEYVCEGAFAYTGIESFAFPEAQINIREETFYNSDIKCVYIGKNVSLIDYEAFGSCDNLKDVYYGGSEAEWKEVSIKGEQSIEDATIHYNHKHDHETVLEDYTVPSTCVERGKEYGQCVCGAVVEVPLELNLNNHANTTYQNSVEATCVAEGKDFDKYCKSCNTVFEIGKNTPIDPNNHNFVTEIENVKSTCKTKGWIINQCACGKTETQYQSLDYNNHEGTTRIEGAVEPNCVRDGQTGRVVCNSCDETIEYGKFLSRTFKHTDENHDGKCDVSDCRKDFTLYCDCRCHDGGLINQIIMFFWKLFRIKKECECGLYHY